MKREAQVDAEPASTGGAAREAPPSARAGGAGPGPLAEPDPSDLEAVIDAYETPLLRYVRHLIGPGPRSRPGTGGACAFDEAEDVVQETFLRLHRYVQKRGAGEVRDLARFLFRVAHNAAMDALRRKATREKARDGKLREAARAAALEDGNSPEGLAAMVRRAACERAVEELGKLPPQQRQVLLLRIVQEMTMRDIAHVTGMSLGNVAYQMNRALAELARRLKAAGVV